MSAALLLPVVNACKHHRQATFGIQKIYSEPKAGFDLSFVLNRFKHLNSNSTWLKSNIRSLAGELSRLLKHLFHAGFFTKSRGIMLYLLFKF